MESQSEVSLCSVNNLQFPESFRDAGFASLILATFDVWSLFSYVFSAIQSVLM